MEPKEETYGTFVIKKDDQGRITVTDKGVTRDNAKAALREIAHQCNFDVDVNWNTQQLGAKLIAFLAGEASAHTTAYCVKGCHDSTDNENKIKRDEIVLNRMFAGGYLADNIGHEIINLYKADGGESKNESNYIYIQPLGSFAREHHNRIKYVLMVRGVEGIQSLEVLALATISDAEKDVYNPYAVSSDVTREEQMKFIINNDIKYCGESLIHIFANNNQDKYRLYQDVYISLKAESVSRPNKKTYILFGKDGDIDRVQYLKELVGIKVGNKDHSRAEDEIRFVHLPEVNQARCSLKQYFGVNDDRCSELLQLINDKDFWGTDTTVVDPDNISGKKDNFFDICGIADYELAFSNALAYFMRIHPELVVDFVKEHFKTTVKPFYTVERETGNIDILLGNDEYLVVIENKITSKINGIQVKDEEAVGNQLLKYIQEAIDRVVREEKENEEGEKNDVDNTNASIQENSIDDYREIDLSKRPAYEKKIRGILLTPNYNQIALKNYNIDARGFKCEEWYKPITYGELYEFLKDKYKEDMYFQEFVKAMEKHTKPYHNDLFEDMKQKLKARVDQIKDGKKSVVEGLH